LTTPEPTNRPLKLKKIAVNDQQKAVAMAANWPNKTTS
jgi:hypothetical protein